METTPQGELREIRAARRRCATTCARLLAVAAAALTLAGCDWVGLAWGALTYPTTADGVPANVVAEGRFAYAARGGNGIEVIELAAPSWRRVVAAPRGATVDDLALADGLLFALDARPPGNLSVYSLADPAQPVLVQAPVMTEVGPFSGVSAASGLVVVSGGTSRLTLRRYAADGRLGAQVATADLGRGQPDVLLAPDGRHAFVSVHDSGPHFSLVVLALEADPLAIHAVAKLPLETYGFTPGGAKPANFPVEMALAGDLLLVASAAGLQVFNAAEPASPRPLATLKPGAMPVNVDAAGALAALVGSEPEPVLSLVDIADPSEPKTLRLIPLPAGSLATGVALAGRQVAVAAHAAGTLVFNLDDPNP